MTTVAPHLNNPKNNNNTVTHTTTLRTPLTNTFIQNKPNLKRQKITQNRSHNKQTIATRLGLPKREKKGRCPKPTPYTF
jgi:hypothetical protein